MGKNNLQNVQANKQNLRGIAFSGPVPPPGILEAYGRIDPSYPERIMKQFEANSEHLRKMGSEGLRIKESENKEVFTTQKRGQFMAFLLAIALLLFVWYALDKGQPWFASGALFVAVGTVATAFLKSNK